MQEIKQQNGSPEIWASKLKAYFAGYEGAIIAFSGGVDSALLAYVAHLAFGDNMLAAMADSPSLSRREYRHALNFAQTRQGKSRLTFEDTNGKIQNLIGQVRNVKGRAVYNSGKFWIDSKLQAQKMGKIIRIKFASEKYFNLLKEEPETAQFFALGRNLKFSLNNKIYEIYE